MAAMPITPDFEPLREPGRNGRLLGYYDARRGILKIKRSDGPECTFDLADKTAKALQQTPQPTQDVV